MYVQLQSQWGNYIMKISEVMVVTKMGGHLQHLAGRARDANHRTVPNNIVLCSFHIIKICILHSFQISKLSRNATTRTLNLFQNLIRNWSWFQKIMSPIACWVINIAQLPQPVFVEAALTAKSTLTQAPDYLLMEVCLNTYPPMYVLSYLNHFYSSSLSQLGHYIDLLKQVQAGYISCEFHFRMFH